MWRSRILLVVGVGLLSGGLVATTFPVTKTDDTNDGVCDADCSLREAIDAANANPGADEVPVPAGTYLLTLGQLEASDDVSIVGAGQTSTIIDGNASDRVFYTAFSLVDLGVEISDVTIQNGSRGSGGGIANGTGTLTLNNTTVSGNNATVGGGIDSYGTLTLNNTTVSGNTAYGFGGGIFGSGTLTLNNSTVSGNDSFGPGGGVYCFGTLDLNNTTVSGNRSFDGGGGGIGVYSIECCAVLTVSSSVVSGNTSYDDGGGIFSNGPSVVSLVNSTVSGNTATGNGGGVSALGGLGSSTSTTLAISNSTVSGNSAELGGDGIYLGSFNVQSTLVDTIVADNGGVNCGGSLASLGYNLSDDGSCGFTEPTDLIVADAKLGPLQDNGGPTNTHDLLAGSPAIDAGGVNCPPPDTDQRGVVRPQGAACDIGAVEHVPEPRGVLELIAGVGLLGFLYQRRLWS